MRQFAIATVLGALLLAGCGPSSEVKVEPLVAVKLAPEPAADAPAQSARGAEVWGQQCNRCHYARSPSFYNDAQWEVAMMHMRVRAKLTADDYRAILAFLKAGR
jgi:cytochrome c5